jgi:hypothetical protein
MASSRPGQYVLKHEESGRYASPGGWVPNPKHALKYPSKYAAKMGGRRLHTSESWTVEKLHEAEKKEATSDRR